MNRRIAIQQVLVFAGGLALTPSFLKGAGRASIFLNHLNISSEQEQLIGEIAQIIIPKTNTPGARDLGVHLFVLKMLDDCYTTEVQQQFLAGLGSLAEQNKTQLRQSIADLNSGKTGVSPDTKAFFKLMKQQTINGYLNSEYVMTKLIFWELVPGRYNGYFPVKA